MQSQSRQTALGILLVDYGQALLGLGESEVALEVDKLGLYVLYFRVLNLAYKPALVVAVAGNGRDGRFVYLLLGRVDTLLLVHGDIVVVTEVVVGKGHNLLLGDV